MKYFLAATLSIISAASHADPQNKPVHGTKDCVFLLPAGQQYKYTIEGTVDEAQNLKESVTIAGNVTPPKESPEVQAQAKAQFEKDTARFKRCLHKVLDGQ